MRIDLHVHSKYSLTDGGLEPEEIVRIARKKGLQGVAVTDHNTVAGGQEAKNFETEEFKVIVGAEIKTEKGEVTGLFLSEEIRSRRFREVIDEIRAQGGMVVVPHPFDSLRSSAFPITAKYVHLVDAIEVFNSRCVFRSHNKKALEFALRHNLAVVGGSDAHYGSEIGLAGIVTSSQDLRKAIEGRDVVVFGKRSSPLNHVRTKIRKQWRKISR